MRRVALIVGVDEYADQTIRRLEYARKDAVEVYGFLKNRGGYEAHLMQERVTSEGVLGKAQELTEKLGSGDLFLFYFAGHGMTQGGRHLLLSPEAKLKWLQEFTNGTVPVDLLRKQTAGCGVQRVFVLDACRTNLVAGRQAGAGDFNGERALRDVVKGPREEKEGPLTVFCSCSDGGSALELSGLGHGLFSRALLDEMGRAVEEGREVVCGQELMVSVGRGMAELAQQCECGGAQKPFLGLGPEVPVLIGGRTPQKVRDDAAAGTKPIPAVRCPKCGKNNLVTDTFGCTKCGIDHLCLRHRSLDFDGTCGECAAKAVRDQEAARAIREREFARVAREKEAAGAPVQFAPAQQWTNSLGMVFVGVPKAPAFSIWDVRVKDYAVYAAANGGVDEQWKSPGFEQTGDHPVVNVS